MDIDDQIIEEVDRSNTSSEFLIVNRELPVTLTYHHSIEGKLTKQYQSYEQFQRFLSKFDIIDSVAKDDGSLLLLVQLKRRCKNCDYFEFSSLFGGECTNKKIKNARREQELPSNNYDYCNSTSREFGSDCTFHRRGGKFIIPINNPIDIKTRCEKIPKRR